MKLCFATNNAHKLEEVAAALAKANPAGTGGIIELVTLAEIGCIEELPETGDTLEANSHQKAAYLYQHYGVNCFADDTGLEVTALDGEPGVYSARYAGPQRNSADNVELLLKNLEGKTDRYARFRAVFTLILDGATQQFEGIVTGQIIDAPRGSKGFGYDPVFMPDGYDRTFGEMDLVEKNRINHRTRALEKLVGYLRKVEK